MPSERVQRPIDRLLDDVEEAISRFDWNAARQGARAVLALDAENADALAYLAAAERDLGGPHPQPPFLTRHRATGNRHPAPPPPHNWARMSMPL